jgi:protein KTI12
MIRSCTCSVEWLEWLNCDPMKRLTFLLCRIQSIAARFEIPNEKNRWDSPLFRLTPESIEADGIPLGQIADVVRYGKAMKEGPATRSAPVAETSFIQELDEVTSSIVDALIAHQRDGSVADALKVPKASTVLRLNRNMPASEVRRHRRQFVKISQLVPFAVSAIGDYFVEYLNKQA